MGKIVLGLTALLLLCACGVPKTTPIAGKYDYVNSSIKATLTLRKDGTYQLCAAGQPCSAGTYRLMVFKNDPDDRITFIGAGMAGFGGGMKQKDKNGNDVFVTEADVVYDSPACPCFGFVDPDTGVRFVKASD